MGLLDGADLARQIAPLNRRISVRIGPNGQQSGEPEVPYDTIEALPPAVRRLPKAQQQRFLAVFNAAWKTYAGDTDREQKAYAAAWAAVNERTAAEWDTAYINDLPDSAFAVILPGGTKDETGRTVPRSLRKLPYRNAKGEVDLPHLRNALSRLPQTDLPEAAKARARRVLERAAAQAEVGDREARDVRLRDSIGQICRAYELTGRRRIMVFPRGTFKHPEYGEMEFDDDFFQEIKRNFDTRVLGQTEPFIDVDHDHGAACGWIKQLSIEPDGLYATVDWTPLGYHLVGTGQYRYFSPWWGSYKDPASGRTYDRVLRGGGLTNVPFLKVLPPLALFEPGVKSAARTAAWTRGVQFRLSEMTPVGAAADGRGAHVRAAFAEAFVPRTPPGPAPVWIVELLDDAVVAGFEEGAQARYYRIPYVLQEGRVEFFPERRVEVQQGWLPVPSGLTALVQLMEQRRHDRVHRLVRTLTSLRRGGVRLTKKEAVV